MRDVIWVGSSLDDLSEFPDEVKDEVGYVLYLVQLGQKTNKVKHLTGFDGGVMEIVSNYDKNAFRVVYAAKIGETIYVLHSFQKKSKSGISIPKPDKNVIEQRIKDANKLESANEKSRGK
jgi:phage-related protein